MKKCVLARLAVFLIVLGALLPLLMPRPPRVTRGNFDRIRVGMSRKELDAILGPAGDYCTRPVVFACTDIKLGEGCEPNRSEEWNWDEGAVLVFFDKHDTVCRKVFLETEGPEPGAVETLRWRWDRWRKSLFK